MPGQTSGALAWVLAQGDDIVVIPGTKHIEYMKENFHAGGLDVDSAILARAGQLINQQTVVGNRYSVAMQAAVDTERFPDEAEHEAR